MTHGDAKDFSSTLFASEGFNQLACARHGHLLYSRNDMYVGRAIENYGEYGEIEAQLFTQICCAGHVVVEVGANIGAHTVLLSKVVGPTGHIHAYEPQPIVFQTLCANMALNSITNVSCHHSAVGAAAGVILMPDIRYDVKGNFGGVSADAFSEALAIVRLSTGPQEDKEESCVALQPSSRPYSWASRSAAPPHPRPPRSSSSPRATPRQGTSSGAPSR